MNDIITKTTKQTQNLELSEQVVTDINIDIEQLITCQEYLPLSGGTVTGDVKIDDANLSIGSNLSVSSNINIGTNNILGETIKYSLVGGNTSKCYSSQSISFGNNCAVGARGYKIISSHYDRVNDKRYFKVDISNGPISEEIIGLQYSINLTYANTNVGKVLDIVNSDYGEIYVDKLVPYDPGQTALPNKCIFFIAAPHIGNVDIATGSYSCAIGFGNQAPGTCGYAEGGYTVAAGTYAHAEGKSTIASWGSHAEGCNTQALGNATHSQNRLTIAKNNYSTASGYGTAALGYESQAGGYGAIAKGHRSFVWSGSTIEGYNYELGGKWKKDNKSDDATAMEILNNEISKAENNQDSDLYVSHGDGTFNINPENGLCGFYIGEKNLNDILSNLSVMIKTQILSELEK